MAHSIRPESRKEARARERSEQLCAYASPNAKDWARVAYENSHGKPAPPLFQQWRWWTLPAPRHRQDGLRWKWRRLRLGRHLQAGGVLVLVGPPRSGKSGLLERLGIQAIASPLSQSRSDVHIGREDVPSEPFAIDETTRHVRDDVVHMVEVAAVRKRGFALVFQHSDSFRDYEIAAFLAERHVLFLELLMD